MTHRFTRINTHNDCESFITGYCTCGFKTETISCMHNLQLHELNRQETNHLKLQDGKQRLFIGKLRYLIGENEIDTTFLFRSTKAGIRDVYYWNGVQIGSRGCSFVPDPDEDNRYWCNDGYAFDLTGVAEIEEAHETTIERYFK